MESSNNYNHHHHYFTSNYNHWLIKLFTLTFIHSFLFLQIILLISSTTAATDSTADLNTNTAYGYGVSCQNDLPCQNYSLLLYCNTDKQRCECVQKTAVIFDSTISQCQLIAGKACYRPNPNLNYEDDLREHLHVPCVPNAICQIINQANPNNKLCLCTSEYYANEDGICVRRKDYGMSCKYQAGTSIDECDTNRYFVCGPKGVCGCEPGLEYDTNLNTCYIPIGSNCAKSEPEIVVHSAKRDPSRAIPGRYDRCPLHSECIKGICTCWPGYTVSSDNSCHLGWGKSCNSSLDRSCSDFQFICRNGTCQCKYPLHQIYDKDTGVCLSIVPGPCTLSNSNYNGNNNHTSSQLKCIPNAECVSTTSNDDDDENETTLFGQCRCESRYKQDKNGHCVKPFGHECQFDSECQNIKTQLVCVNNSCGCPDLLQIYDREREACLGLVGSRCELIDAELVKHRLILIGNENDNNNNIGNDNNDSENSENLDNNNNGDWLNGDNKQNETNNNHEDGNNNELLFLNNNDNNHNTGVKNDFYDENTLSWCIEGSECKPFGPLAQFGRVGECICLKDDGWSETTDRKCVKLF